MTGKGHPLPGSREARHNEVPEHLERDKGRGDDSAPVVQPPGDAVTPEGEPYRYDDLGRGPAAAPRESDMADTTRDDIEEGAPGETPRDQEQSGLSAGGRQVGGGPSAPDMAAPGGSSGAGGYGKAQNQELHQGQQDASLSGDRSDGGLSRGDRFDAQQGGGRGAKAVSADEDIERDQAAHQDRGQSVADAEAAAEGERR